MCGCVPSTPPCRPCAARTRTTRCAVGSARSCSPGTRCGWRRRPARSSGFLALSEGWVDQLYLEPVWRGGGIGDRFVALARRRQPAGLQLWTFQVNEAARRFYERQGFVAAEWTDGAGNEEREPDVRYVWPSSR